jgi:methyl-accepting chemotaxis protein
MKLSMRNKFLVPTLTLIVVALAVSALVSYYNAKDSLEKVSTSQVVRTANDVTELIAMWVKDRKLDVATWSQQKVYQTASSSSFMGKAARKTANKQLADLQKSYGYYEELILIDPNGDIIASSNLDIIGKINLKERAYFKGAIKGEPQLSRVIISKSSGNPVFVVANPVIAKQKVVSVLIGVVSLSDFTKAFVDKIQIGESGYAYMADEKGKILAYPDPKHILKLDISKFDFGQEMLSKKQGLIEYTFEGVHKLAAYGTDQSTGWLVVITADQSELLAPALRVGYLNLIIGIVSVLLAGLLVFFITQSIMKPLNRSIEGLGEGANQVALASGQMANASQQLAEGSSEQAASLEETSSSMEEMASMTRQNAENAIQANSLMDEATQVVSEADQAMDKLTTSMEEISRASEQTAGIIKTIDEIAFQTNLLALNAAVEAARAGEAGAGFAVVADEVRNLAMRAADAAKNTAELIEGTVKQIGEGSDLVGRTAEAFSRVSESTEKVSDLVGEISAASQEQAQGIDQVTKAVGEMDTLTQKNAANAEETASAAETMNAQAVDIRGFVADLVVLASGGKSGAKSVKQKGSKAKTRKSKSQNQAAQLDYQRPAGKSKKEAASKIPLEEDDFADF